MNIKELLINMIGLSGAVLGGYVGYQMNDVMGAVIGVIAGYFMAIVGTAALTYFMWGAFVGLSVLVILFVIMTFAKNMG